MKRSAGLLGVVLLMSCSMADKALAEKPATPSIGETEFKQHCTMCHPDGGNIVNPKKTLHKKDMDAHGVKTEADIMKLIRKPGPGMAAFDKKTISDDEAKEISKYILTTFK